MSREPTTTYTTTEMRKSYRKKLNSYFTEMGVDPVIVERMLSVPASDISILSNEELRTLKLITGLGDVGDFTMAESCKQETLPRNCIELATQ